MKIAFFTERISPGFNVIALYLFIAISLHPGTSVAIKDLPAAAASIKLKGKPSLLLNNTPI